MKTNPQVMPLLDRKKYNVIGGQIFNREKLETRQKAFKESLIKGYEYNSYANRLKRRQMARNVGDLKRNAKGQNNWPSYKDSENPQTYIKAEKLQVA